MGAAMLAAEESVGIIPDLVRANALVFELDLAAVLANLSGYLRQLGRFQHTTEAEEVFGHWGGANPAGVLPAPAPPPGEHRGDAGRAVSGRPAPLGVGCAVVQLLTAHLACPEQAPGEAVLDRSGSCPHAGR
ncbi:hypothetical protein NIE79_004677 [Micromonospora sp. NIE79]|uniref:Uncharacterized protein n=1 Tax=Micromonospora trifolii TaxID=2911208 RepID=A0ABS9N829_9ACTN|nr:hypothetical protein [Micromonospora trifolii]MCG5446112.1 hypothetical protein [Micromonospora trifolii]